MYLNSITLSACQGIGIDSFHVRRPHERNLRNNNCRPTGSATWVTKM